MKKKISLQARILTQIEKEHIVPIPSWQYRAMKYFFWTLLIVFILISAIFAVFLLQDSLDVFRFRAYAPSTIFPPGMIWLGLIVGLAYFGLLIFRRTTVGYRYSIIRDIIIGFFIIIFLIPLLKLSGIGPFLHSELFDTFPKVSNFVYQASSWNTPDSGRIAGTIVGINSKTITLYTLDTTTYDIDFSQAKVVSSLDLRVGIRIRVLGKSRSDRKFIADRILPWFGEGAGNGGFGKYENFFE